MLAHEKPTERTSPGPAYSISGFVLISGHDGDDARNYQEKQLSNAVRQVQT